MEFSGERYVPNVDTIEDLYYQHMARYMFAANFINKGLVLDLGCGTGYGTFYLSKNGADNIVGVDVSEEAIEYASENYISQNVSFKVEDATKLSFADNSFDAIVSFEVIEHISDYKKYLMEIKRVLKKDGFLIVSTPNKFVSSPDSEKPINKYHIKEFEPDELRLVLENEFNQVTMFAEDKIEGIGFTQMGADVCAQKIIGQNNFASSCKLNNENIDNVKLEIDKKKIPFMVFICSNIQNDIQKDQKYTPFIFPSWKEMQTTIVDRNNWIKILQEEKSARDLRITDLENTLRERENWINTILDEKQVRDLRIADLENTLKERENWIKILQEEKQSRDERIVDLENQVNTLQIAGKKQLDNVNDLNNQLLELDKSFIKRLTYRRKGKK